MEYLPRTLVATSSPVFLAVHSNRDPAVPFQSLGRRRQEAGVNARMQRSQRQVDRCRIPASVAHIPSGRHRSRKQRSRNHPHSPSPRTSGTSLWPGTEVIIGKCSSTVNVYNRWTRHHRCPRQHMSKKSHEPSSSVASALIVAGRAESVQPSHFGIRRTHRFRLHPLCIRTSCRRSRSPKRVQFVAVAIASAVCNAVTAALAALVQFVAIAIARTVGDAVTRHTSPHASNSRHEPSSSVASASEVASAASSVQPCRFKFVARAIAVCVVQAIAVAVVARCRSPLPSQSQAPSAMPSPPHSPHSSNSVRHEPSSSVASAL